MCLTHLEGKKETIWNGSVLQNLFFVNMDLCLGPEIGIAMEANWNALAVVEMRPDKSRQFTGRTQTEKYIGI